MAISFDANSGPQQATTDTGPSWSHTIGSGSNRILVVCMSWLDPSADISDITYNGVSMTRVTGANAGPQNSYFSAIFYMLEANLPTTGAYTVAVTWANNPHADYFVGGGLSFDGVAQAAPEDSDGQIGGTTTTSASVTITSGAMIVANAASQDTGGVLGLAFDSGTETERWDTDQGLLAGLASTVPDATAGAVGVDATASGNHNCALSVISLAEAGAGTTHGPLAGEGGLAGSGGLAGTVGILAREAIRKGRLWVVPETIISAPIG